MFHIMEYTSTKNFYYVYPMDMAQVGEAGFKHLQSPEPWSDSRYNAALSACTSVGLSTAGRCFVCLIEGLFVCRTGSILTARRRLAERYSASIMRTSAIPSVPEGSGAWLLRIQLEK